MSGSLEENADEIACPPSTTIGSSIMAFASENTPATLPRAINRIEQWQFLDSLADTVPSEAFNGALNEGYSYGGIIINAAILDIDTFEHENAKLEHENHRPRHGHEHEHEHENEHTLPRREIRDLRAEIDAVCARLWFWQDSQRE